MMFAEISQNPKHTNTICHVAQPRLALSDATKAKGCPTSGNAKRPGLSRQSSQINHFRSSRILANCCMCWGLHKIQASSNSCSVCLWDPCQAKHHQAASTAAMWNSFRLSPGWFRIHKAFRGAAVVCAFPPAKIELPSGKRLFTSFGCCGLLWCFSLIYLSSSVGCWGRRVHRNVLTSKPPKQKFTLLVFSQRWNLQFYTAIGNTVLTTLLQNPLINPHSPLPSNHVTDTFLVPGCTQAWLLLHRQTAPTISLLGRAHCELTRQTGPAGAVQNRVP